MSATGYSHYICNLGAAHILFCIQWLNWVFFPALASSFIMYFQIRTSMSPIYFQYHFRDTVQFLRPNSERLFCVLATLGLSSQLWPLHTMLHLASDAVSGCLQFHHIQGLTLLSCDLAQVFLLTTGSLADDDIQWKMQYWPDWANLILALALHTLTEYWIHWVNVIPALLFVVLAYLLHWVNRIPALATCVFIYLLHWANRIPALALSYS